MKSLAFMDDTRLDLIETKSKKRKKKLRELTNKPLVIPIDQKPNERNKTAEKNPVQISRIFRCMCTHCLHEPNA